MPLKIFKTLLFRSAIYTFAMLLVWIFFNSILHGNVWEGMEISKSALKVEYCEFNDINHFFHQAMNTYSNLAYFFFGVFICQIAFYDQQHSNKQNRLVLFPVLSLLMGVCFIYLCFGSAFFHASLTWIGQRVDMNGTYSISLTLLSIALYHVFHAWNPSEQAKKYFIVILLVVILSFFKISLLIPSGILLPVLILISTLLILINYFQFRKQRHLILAVLSFGLMVFAIQIRSLDVQKINCDPHACFQGHAAWHLLTAMSSFCNYAFFRFSR